MLPPPGWWSLLMQHCGVPAGTGRQVRKALVVASTDDAELTAFLYTLCTMPSGTRFLEVMRAVFRQHGLPWWCLTKEEKAWLPPPFVKPKA